MPSDSQFNPSPDTEPAEPSKEPLTRGKIVRKFRDYIHVLGALWIITGMLVAGISLNEYFKTPQEVSPSRLDPQTVSILLATLGVIWLVLGILTCCKQRWAVYIALVFSWLTLLANIYIVNVCGICLMAFIVLHAHTVLRLANVLDAAGLPLTTKPD